MHYARNGFLTIYGLAEAELRGVDRAHELAMLALDGETCQLYLDKVRSVSGSRRDEIKMIFDDGVIDEQHRRFLDAVARSEA